MMEINMLETELAKKTMFALFRRRSDGRLLVDESQYEVVAEVEAVSWKDAKNQLEHIGVILKSDRVPHRPRRP